MTPKAVMSRVQISQRSNPPGVPRCAILNRQRGRPALSPGFGAREVKGKMGGRKSHSELRPNVVALSKQLRKRQKSLREISRELAARGHLSRSGKPFTARSVSNMLEVS